jgi:iron(III) transport system substrate-binding protein
MQSIQRISAVLAVSALLTLPAAAQGRLNVICAQTADWCTALAAAFEKDTGIKVAMQMKFTGEILAQLRAEKDNPKVDLWWSGTTDPFLVAAEEKLIERYESPRLGEVAALGKRLWDMSDGRAVGISAGVIGITYNREVFAKKKLTPPKCWADLANPAYKGELQLPHPASSGTAYILLATLVQLFGEDKAFDLMKAMHGNVTAYTRSGTAPVRAAAQGEAGMALSFAFGVETERQNGFPLEQVEPCEGTGLEVTGLAIVTGARNVAEAKRFYDWYLTPAAMSIGAAQKQYHTPLIKGAALDQRMSDLSKSKLIDYDFKTYGSAATRKRLLDRWEREIGALPR